MMIERLFVRGFVALAVFGLALAWAMGQWAGATVCSCDDTNPTTTTSSSTTTSTSTSTSTTSTTLAPPATVPVPPSAVEQPPPPELRVVPAAPVQPALPETGAPTGMLALIGVLAIGAGWFLMVQFRPSRRRGSRRLLR